jgi:hypothetical protein
VEELAREFASGATPVAICARTIRAMRALGVRHFCICNLPMQDASAIVAAILEQAA